MYKSTVTSKGQLTIPKQIRDYLEVSMGDGVIFKLIDNHVQIEKENGMIECPVCEGKGSLKSDNASQITCFMCDGKTRIESKKTCWEWVSSINWIKHNIALSVIHQDLVRTSNTKVSFHNIPKIVLYSKHCPVNSLEQGNDYIQMQFIKEYLPRSHSNPGDFMIPSQVILDDILGLLRQPSSKEQVKEWFRF